MTDVSQSIDRSNSFEQSNIINNNNHSSTKQQQQYKREGAWRFSDQNNISFSNVSDLTYLNRARGRRFKKYLLIKIQICRPKVASKMFHNNVAIQFKGHSSVITSVFFPYNVFSNNVSSLKTRKRTFSIVVSGCLFNKTAKWPKVTEYSQFKWKTPSKFGLNCKSIIYKYVKLYGVGPSRWNK